METNIFNIFKLHNITLLLANTSTCNILFNKSYNNLTFMYYDNELFNEFTTSLITNHGFVLINNSSSLLFNDLIFHFNIVNKVSTNTLSTTIHGISYRHIVLNLDDLCLYAHIDDSITKIHDTLSSDIIHKLYNNTTDYSIIFDLFELSLIYDFDVDIITEQLLNKLNDDCDAMQLLFESYNILDTKYMYDYMTNMIKQNVFSEFVDIIVNKKLLCKIIFGMYQQ